MTASAVSVGGARRRFRLGQLGQVGGDLVDVEEEGAPLVIGQPRQTVGADPPRVYESVQLRLADAKRPLDDLRVHHFSPPQCHYTTVAEYCMSRRGGI